MKRLNLSAPQLLLLSFFGVILAGSILLSLPFCSADGVSVPYIDALFTATTATCVTGLVTVTTATAWSTAGHIVILLLIQIGGLGTIAVASGLMILIRQRLSIHGRLLVQDAFNLNTMSGMTGFIKKVMRFTFIAEGIGAVGYCTVFVPRFGFKGIWISVFTSVSAFCNAGIDIIAKDSLCSFAANPIINLVTCLLIVFGGIGYMVWFDLGKALSNIKNRGIKCFEYLTLHSKIVLSLTAVLIFGGALAIFCFEYNNQLTLGNMKLYDKIQAAFFQSVTTRTAGFATVPQENLTGASGLVSVLLMFIGGSPAGTAGGIKTVTFAVLLFSSFASVRNRENISLFGRNIPKGAVSKALAVFGMSFIITFIASVLLSAVTDAPAFDIIYETVSATATVGLTRNLTPTLKTAGKIIVIAAMYLGRIGPISLALAFSQRKQRQNIIKNPTEDVSIG